MKKTTIIFDFDGTIADTWPVVRELIKKLAPQYGYQNIADTNFEMIRGLTYQGIAEALKIPWVKIPFFLVIGRRELRKEIDSIQPIHGILAVLEKLKENGLNLMILSSNSRENIQTFLDRHNLNLFDEIISEYDIFGKDRVLNKIVRERGLDKNTVIYIGDEIRDVEASLKAGIDVAAVTWGFNTRELLKKSKPTYLLDKPEDLKKLLTRN